MQQCFEYPRYSFKVRTYLRLCGLLFKDLKFNFKVELLAGGPPPFRLPLIGLPPTGLPPTGLPPFGLRLKPFGLRLKSFGLRLKSYRLPPFGLSHAD